MALNTFPIPTITPAQVPRAASIAPTDTLLGTISGTTQQVSLATALASTNQSIQANTQAIAANTTAINNIGLQSSGKIVFASRITGIDPTLATDSRAALNTIIQGIAGTGTTLYIDCPLYVNIGTNVNAPIFVPSNTSIYFTENGVIYADGVGLPVFVFMNVHDWHFVNTKFAYCAGLFPSQNGVGDAFSFGGLQATLGATGGPAPVASSTFNDSVLTAYLTTSGANVFTNGGRALYSGSTNAACMFYIGGACTRGYFTGDCRAYVPDGVKAAYFIPTLFSFFVQWNVGLAVNAASFPIIPANFTTPSEIYFGNWQIDGYCMGWMGSASTWYMDSVRAFRYSDFQDPTGGGIGGGGGHFWAPPHLVYVIGGSQPVSTRINNYYDEGIYVGTPIRRSTSSGSILSLKIETGNDLVINNCTSLRPDGWTDLEYFTATIPGSSIRGVYVKFDSSTLQAGGPAIWASRFPGPSGPTDSLVMDDVTIIDVAAAGSQAFPFQSGGMNNCSLTGIKIIMSDWPAGASFQPAFGIAGNNNRLQAEIHFKKCNALVGSKGSFVNAGANVVTNSDIDIKVFGWRQFTLTFATSPAIGDTSATLVTSWGTTTGVYQVPFSSGEVRYVTLTSGSTAVSWTPALTAAASITAIAGGGLAVNYAGFKQTPNFMQGGKSTGNRVRILDVSNQWEYVSENGVATETYTQIWTGTPPAGGAFALPIVFPATMAAERVGYKVNQTFGATGGLTSINVGHSTNASAFLVNQHINTTNGANPIFGPAPFTGSTGAVVLTPVGGTFDGTGSVTITVRASQMLESL
jgi:hypothetical protein